MHIDELIKELVKQRHSFNWDTDEIVQIVCVPNNDNARTLDIEDFFIWFANAKDEGLFAVVDFLVPENMNEQYKPSHKTY